jgi:glycosyltransferase involved in cell wall biosynthesis
MQRLYINGKFCAQRPTGVQRVALQQVTALDQWLHDAAQGQATTAECARLRSLGTVTLLCPPQAQAPALQQVQVRRVGPPGLPLHLWEQIVLPLAARGGRLLSLAGSAPWWARSPAAMLHDAAVWDHPRAYRPLFVWWYRALFRRQARAARLLLTVSVFSRQRLAACLHVPPERLVVVHNGADHLDAVHADDGLLARLGLSRGSYLLAVGSANPTKNLDALVRAHGRWPAGEPPVLVIVGGRSARVFSAGQAAPEQAGVLRPGAVDDAGLKALYANALGLVFPSLYEGFGLPPLEAMRLGCPVLAARAAALPEVYGDAALYFDPYDEEALLRAMVRLATEPTLRQRLRAQGLAQAARYTWRAAARELVDALAGPVAAAQGGSA